MQQKVMYINMNNIADKRVLPYLLSFMLTSIPVFLSNASYAEDYKNLRKETGDVIIRFPPDINYIVDGNVVVLIDESNSLERAFVSQISRMTSYISFNDISPGRYRVELLPWNSPRAGLAKSSMPVVIKNGLNLIYFKSEVLYENENEKEEICELQVVIPEQYQIGKDKDGLIPVLEDARGVYEYAHLIPESNSQFIFTGLKETNYFVGLYYRDAPRFTQPLVRQRVEMRKGINKCVLQELEKYEIDITIDRTQIKDNQIESIEIKYIKPAFNFWYEKTIDARNVDNHNNAIVLTLFKEGLYEITLTKLGNKGEASTQKVPVLISREQRRYNVIIGAKGSHIRGKAGSRAEGAPRVEAPRNREVPDIAKGRKGVSPVE